MPNFSRLVYVSQAARPFADEDLRRFADADRRLNERAGVTGVLVATAAGGGQLLQALEGDVADVADRFDALRHDAARHRKVARLAFDFAPERLFGAWWMGLVNLDLAAGPAECARLADLTRLARLPRGDEVGAEVLGFLRACKALLIGTTPVVRRAAG